MSQAFFVGTGDQWPSRQVQAELSRSGIEPVLVPGLRRLQRDLETAGSQANIGVIRTASFGKQDGLSSFEALRAAVWLREAGVEDVVFVQASTGDESVVALAKSAGKLIRHSKSFSQKSMGMQMLVPGA